MHISLPNYVDAPFVVDISKGEGITPRGPPNQSRKVKAGLVSLLIHPYKLGLMILFPLSFPFGFYKPHNALHYPVINPRIQVYRVLGSQLITINRVADQTKRRLVTTSELVEDCYDLLFDQMLKDLPPVTYCVVGRIGDSKPNNAGE
ncbi:hypothetical protein Syun_006762 [Stephania yunnanensis]|uniref:Uncharacterized protein n=1 Tax=Stephania yunnanensis TaxID=152371 RepID=A0AAP0Q1P2_9MAGN